MAFEINLVSKEAGKIAKTNKAIENVKMVAYVLVGVFAAIVLGVYGLFFVKRFQVNNLDRRSDELLSQIRERSETEALYRRYQQVLRESSKVIESRVDYQAIIAQVYQMVPEDSRVNSVSFETDQLLEIAVSSSGVQSAGRSIDGIKTEVESGNLFFSKAAISGISRADSAEYISDFQLLIGNKDEDGN